MGHSRRFAWIAAAAVVALVIGLGVWWFTRPPEPTASAPPSPTVTMAPSPTRTPSPTSTPTPTPTPPGFAANTTAYGLEALPTSEVFAVIPAVPVDDEPYAAFTGEAARPRDPAAPVFADPLGEPVSKILRDYVYGGTTVPVVERQEHWVKVLLAGRQAVPSQGNPAQVMGWMRAQDVELSPLDSVVEVSISGHSIDIWQGGTSERLSTDFAWGTPSTPTPVGRTFVMLVRPDPSLSYTRGHPIVYLSVQSPTLDGFSGSSVAVTAFHYHDAHSGQISNGCLRLDAAAIDRLAQLPVGTPVFIRA